MHNSHNINPTIGLMTIPYIKQWEFGPQHIRYSSLLRRGRLKGPITGGTTHRAAGSTATKGRLSQGLDGFPGTKVVALPRGGAFHVSSMKQLQSTSWHITKFSFCYLFCTNIHWYLYKTVMLGKDLWKKDEYFEMCSRYLLYTFSCYII